MAKEYEPMLYFSKHINNPLRGAGNHEEIPLAAINDVISTSEFDSQFPDDNKPFMQHQWLQKSFCNLQSADPASSTPLQTLNGEKKVYTVKVGCSSIQNPPAAMANVSGAETNKNKAARSGIVSRDSIRQSAVTNTDHNPPSKLPEKRKFRRLILTPDDDEDE